MVSQHDDQTVFIEPHDFVRACMQGESQVHRELSALISKQLDEGKR